LLFNLAVPYTRIDFFARRVFFGNQP